MKKQDGFRYTIHPNTVIVPNNSLKGDYVMEENETSKFPNLYLSYILPSDGWDVFRAEADSLGYAGWFVYGDGGKAEVLEENERRQTALSEWQSAVEKWGKPLPTSSTVLMAVVIFAFVLSKKKEIGRLYAIETPKRTLFVHFFVQTTIVGAVAFGLALLLSPPILSRIVPTMLRDLADEPTGNLDSENSDLVMKTFQRLAHEEGYCIIIVTHDPQIADESDVIIRMDSGRIVSADV